MAARNDRSLAMASQLLVGQASALAAPRSGLSRVQRARLVILLDEVLAGFSDPTTARPMAWSEVLRRRAADHAEADELTRDLASSVGESTLANIATSRATDLANALGGNLPMSVHTRHGDVRLADQLRAVLVELVVLALTSDPSDVQPAALRDCARSLSQALGARHPGQTIEVRVPPAAAVQVGALGQGPTHTRGTPPNVAELDEQTWVALATGLVSWADAVDRGVVRASGSHVDDLARMLPVVQLGHLG